MQLSWPDPLPQAGSVRLRPFRDADLPLVAELATDTFAPTIGTIPSPYTPEAGQAYLARQHARLREGVGWSFAIALLADDAAVGTIGLWLMPSTPTARAGYLLAPSARGRGYATAALSALTTFALDTLGLRPVELRIEPENSPSIRVAERCGYRRDGTTRGLLANEQRTLITFAVSAQA